jgi:hypothetical protein
MAQNYNYAPPQGGYAQYGASNMNPQAPQGYYQPVSPPPQQSYYGQAPPGNYQNGQPPPANYQAIQQQAASPTPQLSPEDEAELQLLRKYSHVVRLPLFPIFEYDHGKDQEYRQNLQALMQETSGPQLTPGEKITLHAMSAATGAQFFTMDKALNGLAKLASGLEALGSKPRWAVSYMRWASPPGAPCPPIIVDVFDQRDLKNVEGSGMFTMRVNREAKLKVVDKKVLEKKLKAKKAWDGGTYAALSNISVVEANGVEIALEKVLTLRKPMGMNESSELAVKFRKKWVVPA